MLQSKIRITECPRDAMQGWDTFVPTDLKVKYLNALLKVGFDVLDFGSFVSPKAIPQMADTAQVLDQLEPSDTTLLAIVANERGALEACQHQRVDFLGFPFSVSEEFQRRNTNSDLNEAFKRVESIQNIASQSGKKLMVYLSMAFGNPYGETWHPDLVTQWASRLHEKLDIQFMAPSDTIGGGNPSDVHDLMHSLIVSLPKIQINAHLHTTPEKVFPLVEAAYRAGCRGFDGALKGYGGCPMAKDELTGNMPTEQLVAYCDEKGIQHNVVKAQLQEAIQWLPQIFTHA